MAATDDGSVLHSIILINCEVGMRQYLRICASAVCVPKKPQKNTLAHKRHHPKTNVPQCSFVDLCICVFPKEITALIPPHIHIQNSIAFRERPYAIFLVAARMHMEPYQMQIGRALYGLI